LFGFFTGEFTLSKTIISTENAPAAIGTYSQAVKVGSTVYLSGQIPLDPASMTMVDEDMRVQINQVFKNLSAVCEAAGGSLQDIVKLNIFLTDLSNFALVNEVMAEYFEQPYPARAAIGVAQLPKDAGVEMDGVVELG
jgi:reactive intermediate/imine deaminase